MPLEDLPNGFAAPARSDVRDRFQKDYVLRKPGAPTGEGSEAYIDGSVIADTLMPVYANSVSIARSASQQDQTRAQLMAEAESLGLPAELPAGAGGGFVVISASVGGVFIDTGRQLRDEARNLRFRCAVAGTYFDGKVVPIVGVDTGPATNIPAATRLKWGNPPPGLGAIATVQADPDGNGFSGGRNAETDDDIASRISTARADQAVGGNVATIRKLVRNAGRDLGIAIQEVFVYPAIVGAGHYAYIFTLRPGAVGGSRIPSDSQIAAVRAYIHAALPEDDGILAAQVLEEPVTVKIGVDWIFGGAGWVDANPWPVFSDVWFVASVTSSTVFRVQSAAGAPSSPQVGQTIAFFNGVEGVFSRKRILSATSAGAGLFDLVIDGTNNASDLNYLPRVGDEFCPYSPSLDLLVQPVLSAGDTLGPGEQVADPFDEGLRQRRIPLNPLEWHSDLRYRDVSSVNDLAQVHDAEWLSPAIPYTPAVGIAGQSSSIVRIAVLLAFPL